MKKLSTQTTEAKRSRQQRVKPEIQEKGRAASPPASPKFPSRSKYQASDEEQQRFAESYGSELVISFPSLREINTSEDVG